jgi:hypothetical protein
MTKINETQWLNDYCPIGDAALTDAPVVYNVDIHYVWTETDDGCFKTGIHPVGRVGYWLTEKPWTDPNLVVIEEV